MVPGIGAASFVLILIDNVYVKFLVSLSPLLHLCQRYDCTTGPVRTAITNMNPFQHANMKRNDDDLRIYFLQHFFNFLPLPQWQGSLGFSFFFFFFVGPLAAPFCLTMGLNTPGSAKQKKA